MTWVLCGQMVRAMVFLGYESNIGSQGGGGHGGWEEEEKEEKEQDQQE